MSYCASRFTTVRRPTVEVKVGAVGVGGTNPIRIQSMTTSDTQDIAATVKQSIALAEVGCEIVRITAPNVAAAKCLATIRKEFSAAGFAHIPLVADIHFLPSAAMEAVEHVEKIRVNPGNYADKKKFAVREYTDADYESELQRLYEAFTPLVKRCKELGRAVRVGTNHGSLSDRIMNRYGDTPLGMVESALEFARIARDLDYHAFVFSMKSSNPKVMINAYRLLVARLREEGEDWNYPIHLGVTEAGEGEDARIKSAIGIGSLLRDGIGDTIRVSLTEDSIHEIPVARTLADIVGQALRLPHENTRQAERLPYNPFEYERRGSSKIERGGIKLGGDELIRVVVREASFDKVAHKLDRMGDYQPEIVYETAGVVEIDPRDAAALARLNESKAPQFVTVRDDVAMPVITAFRLLASKIGPHHPILLKDVLRNRKAETGTRQDAETDFLETLLVSATNIGSLLCDGIGDAMLIQGGEAPGQAWRVSYNILQAAGSRICKTDYVACPYGGR